jgi:hypothetical protein
MGQATVDLPDPLSNPAPAAPASADDLLAQLAGDEIDRLLAESDVDKTLPANEPSPVVPKRRAEDKQPTLEPEPQPAAEASPAAGTDDGEIDDLFAKLQAKAEAQPPSEEVMHPVELDHATPSEETGAAERAALGGDEHAVAHDTQPDLDLAGGDLPVILKPLAWISSPLDAFPDAVREAMGKIAIMTMVNAIAVLVYVWIFRGRHHG